MGQLSNEGQSAGPRLSNKVFFHSLHSLKVVLQQSRQNKQKMLYILILVNFKEN